MVERKTLAGYGGVITIALLISLGVNVLPSDTHYCPEKNLSMECARISSTGVTCWPNEQDNKGYKRCSAGWIPIATQVDNITREPGVGCAESEHLRVCITTKN